MAFYPRRSSITGQRNETDHNYALMSSTRIRERAEKMTLAPQEQEDIRSYIKWVRAQEEAKENRTRQHLPVMGM